MKKIARLLELRFTTIERKDREARKEDLALRSLRPLRSLIGLVVLGAVTSVAVVISAQPRAARLLVLSKDDATLAIVDPSSGQVLGRVSTGQGPHELVTSTDGTLAFASNYGTGQARGHTISMIDIAGLKEVRRIDVAPLSRPHGLAFANGKLYFTAEADKKIARYDPATDKIDWQFETGQATTHMVLPTKDLKAIFTSSMHRPARRSRVWRWDACQRAF